jgi:hypothetical protein
MIGFLGTAGAWLSARRGWMTLLAIAAIAAWLYAHYATVRAERDRAYIWRERVCAAAGVDIKAPGFVKGACAARILRLAAFERDATSASNALLERAMAEGNRKNGADLAAMQQAARDARAAAESMEKANAAIGKDDHVGGDWFAALNRAGGLRPAD